MKNILKNCKALSKEELRSINAGSNECERHAHRLNMPPRSMGYYNDPCFWMLMRIGQAQRDN